jgi:hypothetical protein
VLPTDVRHRPLAVRDRMSGSEVPLADAERSCDQDIAGDGAFSLGMIADYMDSLVTYGAAFYRNLFWEAGLVGQVLYLEAEEASIRSTGIGCYFDDPVHEVFGTATGRASTTSRWVAPSRTDGSQPYQRTSWRMNHEARSRRSSRQDIPRHSPCTCSECSSR